MEKIETQSKDREMLFSVLKAGMGWGANPVEVPNDMLTDLLRLAKRQSIFPIAYRGICWDQVPEPIRQKVEAYCSKSVFYFLQQSEALRCVSAVLESAAIPYLPLKGAVLRSLYPEDWLRTSSDLDVLVHPEDLDAAIALLTENAGFCKKKQSDHDVSMLNQYVHLELHFRLSGDMSIPLLDEVWQHSRKTEGSFRYEMDTDYLIFYVLAHMSRHLKAEGLGIRAYLDLFLLLHKTEFDESKLLGMCKESRLLRFYEASKNLAEVWFGEETHTAISSELEKVVLSGGVFGSAETTVFARQRQIAQNTRSSLNYFQRRLFLPAEEMRLRYPELESKPWLLPYLYGKRICHGLKDKRRSIQDEMMITRQQKQESVQFSHLLDELGL